MDRVTEAAIEAWHRHLDVCPLCSRAELCQRGRELAARCDDRRQELFDFARKQPFLPGVL